jgi:pSer/pThr/pTyr-binding forkhead associated (FHA) protein
MVQLRIQSGKMAGTETVVRHFPFRMGRSASADLRLEEDGVWDAHAEIVFDPEAGFLLRANHDALTGVNGKRCHEAVLRNGDELEIGALKLRFWLGATRQRTLQVREWLTWAGLALVTAGQLVLIYRLVP